MEQTEEKKNFYEFLKEAGFLYLYIGSCITADADATIESYNKRIGSLRDLLPLIPEEDAENKKMVIEGLELLERELAEIENMTRVLFLDFDGVLNTERYQAALREKGKATVDEFGPLFDPRAVGNLKRIVESVPGLKIVISSSWKLEGLGRMRTMWAARRLPGEITDVTPDYAPDITGINLEDEDAFKMLAGKGNEIRQWIENNVSGRCKYIILDDVPDFLPEQFSSFFRTDPHVGLGRKDTNRIIRYMCYEFSTEETND